MNNLCELEQEKLHSFTMFKNLNEIFLLYCKESKIYDKNVTFASCAFVDPNKNISISVSNNVEWAKAIKEHPILYSSKIFQAPFKIHNYCTKNEILHKIDICLQNRFANSTYFDNELQKIRTKYDIDNTMYLVEHINNRTLVTNLSSSYALFDNEEFIKNNKKLIFDFHNGFMVVLLKYFNINFESLLLQQQNQYPRLIYKFRSQDLEDLEFAKSSLL